MEGLNFLANIVIIIENITISFLFFIFILHNAHIGVELEWSLGDGMPIFVPSTKNRAGVQPYSHLFSR